VQYTGHVIRNQYTALPLTEVLVTWYGLYGLNVLILLIISIQNANLKLKIVMGANLRFSGSCWISSFSDWFRICGIWSVLYYNLYTKLYIYGFLYRFDKGLFQFLETETSDRCLICILQRLRFSGFILYPLSFFLYSPFNNQNYLRPMFHPKHAKINFILKRWNLRKV